MALPATHRIQVGAIEVTCLADGAADLEGHPYQLTLDGGTEVDWAAYHDRFPDGFHGPDHHWRIHNNCYLVRTRTSTILVDTGVGPGPYQRYRNMRGALMRSFEAAGVTPEEVDTVFLTHAHPDHVAWNVDAKGAPTFPRARYVLHRRDWEHYEARDPVPPYMRRFVEPVAARGLLDLLDHEAELAPGARAIETPGHTPGHMSLLVESAGERLVVTGDVLVSPFYVSEPERPFGSDLDRQHAIRTRLALVDRLEADGMRLASAHFPEPGFGTVVRLEGRRWFRAAL